MRDTPDISEQELSVRLHDSYGIQATEVTQLPLGADPDAAVYRVSTAEGIPFFLKRKRSLPRTAVLALPHFLHGQGLSQIIAPLPNLSGQLWTDFKKNSLILYPFVVGKNGFEAELSERQWQEFGKTLRRIHQTSLPDDLQSQIERETFSSSWRDRVRNIQTEYAGRTMDDPLADAMCALLKTYRQEIGEIVERAENLSIALKSTSHEYVLCHTDIHAGNILVTGSGELYLVDWDTPRLAPRERDLMFIGAGIGGIWNTPREERLFFEGYGEVERDWTALAYYRYERIVEDIAVSCEQILKFSESRENRKEELQILSSQFGPDSVAAIAHRTFQDFVDRGQRSS